MRRALANVEWWGIVRMSRGDLFLLSSASHLPLDEGDLWGGFVVSEIWGMEGESNVPSPSSCRAGKFCLVFSFFGWAFLCSDDRVGHFMGYGERV